MKRSFTLSLFLLAGAACVENTSMIEIDGRLPPDPTGCVFSPSDNLSLSSGLLDVASSAQPHYMLAVVVKNNLRDPQQISAESLTAAKVWRPFAAKVRVNPSDYRKAYGPNPALLSFQGENTTRLTGQGIPPDGGEAVQAIEAISGPLGSQLAGQVAPGEIRALMLGITLQGQTADGAYLDTGEWFFPLDVCNGCLAVPACPGGAAPVASNCFGAGQDSAPTCLAAQ